MIINKIIPQVEESHLIKEVTFLIEEKTALVTINIMGSTDKVITVSVDLTEEIANASTTNLTIIKAFFKKVIALALAVDTSVLPDTLFESNS
jgi:hypothetical protein